MREILDALYVIGILGSPIWIILTVIGVAKLLTAGIKEYRLEIGRKRIRNLVANGPEESVQFLIDIIESSRSSLRLQLEAVEGLGLTRCAKALEFVKAINVTNYSSGTSALGEDMHGTPGTIDFETVTYPNTRGELHNALYSDRVISVYPDDFSGGSEPEPRPWQGPDSHVAAVLKRALDTLQQTVAK